MHTFPQGTLSSSPTGSVFCLLGFLFTRAYSIGWQGGPVAALGLQDPYSQKIQWEEIIFFRNFQPKPREGGAWSSWLMVPSLNQLLQPAWYRRWLHSPLYDHDGRRPSTSTSLYGFPQRCVQLQGRWWRKRVTTSPWHSRLVRSRSWPGSHPHSSLDITSGGGAAPWSSLTFPRDPTSTS